ncbi:TetR/AcrR family transcriptional regulator [Effusibacillus consociatus]|uniref:TetR/AcrR family transcriptional regulator n=1 Tax=Effusibacillus consociatus TaxID=1117041 RepID=A0ABV9Q003_9BACL
MEKRNKHQIKRELSFEKLMEASLKIFAEKGYDKASIDDIAKEAGYTKGTFYLHFSSKEELFLKLMDNRLESFKRQYFEVFSYVEDIEESLRRGVALFIELTKKDNWAPIYFEFCVNSMRNPVIKKQMIVHYHSWIDMVTSVLKQLDPFKECEDTQLKELAALIIAIIDGYHLQYSIDPSIADQNRIIQVIIQLLSSFKSGI